MNTFVIASALFQDFLLNQNHIVRISFWFLDFIYGLLLFSRVSHESIDTAASELFIFSSVYIRTAKIIRNTYFIQKIKPWAATLFNLYITMCFYYYIVQNGIPKKLFH